MGRRIVRVRRTSLRLLALGLLLAGAACRSGSGGQVSQAQPSRGSPLTGTPPGGIAPIVDSIPLLGGLFLDTVRADVFDQGKMWTFEHPPIDYFRAEYGFAPDSAWLRHARMAALRIPGCSASFVSSSGLVLTNHHCARDAITAVTREGEDLLRDGFYARTLEEERPAEELHADQLLAIHDVSDEVDRRLALAPASLRAQRREEIHEQIEERLAADYGGEDAGIVVEVVSLYSGALTSAYVFRRFADVRLVMAPELEVGFFGGEPDNFTYPRYNLDFAFLRVYDAEGAPYASDPYFRWSATGVREGDATFVIGNPGSTSRLETFAQLTFRRDVSDRAVLDFLQRRADIFEEFAAARPNAVRERDLENTIFSLRNSEKAYLGQLEGLRDPVILARLRHREASFLDSIRADSVLRSQYGDVFERMAALQDRKRELSSGYGAFLALTSPQYASATLHRALFAFQYLGALRQAAPISARENLRNQILAVPDQAAELDEVLMQDRFQGFIAAYGADAGMVLEVLDGRSPEGAAAHVRSGSLLADSASAARALAEGTLNLDDPALRVVQAYVPTFGAFQAALRQVSEQEENLAERIGRARFAVYGTSVPPDASFSLRLADGVVRGYPYNGTVAPPYTTLYGLYDRHHSHAGLQGSSGSPWALPERWRVRPEDLDLSTPVNFVSTADITGGNSGSPVVNRTLELVGVVFDGNIESLPGSYIYLPAVNRAVSVDARGILESLRAVYGMDHLVDELTNGRLQTADVGTDSGR